MSKLKILYANADQLNNKKIELETIIRQKDIDVALICESLPKKQLASLPSVPVIMEGYDSLEDSTGRGILILYKEHLELSVIRAITDVYSPALYLKVTNSSTILHLGIVYRSPNISKADDMKLNKQLKLASKKLKNLIIYGDFNHPEIDWKSMNSSKGEDHQATEFLHVVQDCKLDQLVTEFTHLKPNCKPSLIDLILTNNKDLINTPAMLPPLGKSHHAAILTKLDFFKDNASHQEKVKKYQVSKGDYKEINKELNSVDWEVEINSENVSVNAAWDNIASKILEQRDKFVPSILINTQRVKKQAPLNTSLLHLIREKRWYYKRYRKYRNQKNYDLYCIARAQVNKFLRLQRRSKELRIAKQLKRNTKSFYQYISSKATVPKKTTSQT